MASLTEQFTKALQKIKPKQNSVTVEIGVLDPSVAQYAQYVEFGWVQRVTAAQAGWLNSHQKQMHIQPGASLVNPPRPFLRGTAQAESKKWQNVVKNTLKTTGPRGIDLAAQRVGLIATQDIKATIAAGGTSEQTFEQRSPLTMALYSGQSEGHRKDGTGNVTSTKPLKLSGRLLNSIGYEIKKK